MTPPSQTSEISKLETLAGSIPSLPQVVEQLRTELNSENASRNSIEEIVTTDPALTARILKLANSAFYGFSFKVNTISQALMMIGLSELRSMLVSTAMVKFFKGIEPKYLNMESFWTHSLAVGIAAREIAIHRFESEPERLFTAGLLHDFGRLIMLQHFPEKTEEARHNAFNSNIPITHAETRLFTFNHTDLASRILKNWKFPNNIYELVEMHHRPDKDSPFYQESLILHIADIIVDTMEIGNSGEGIISPLPREHLDQIQDISRFLPEVIQAIEEKTSETVKVFIGEDEQKKESSPKKQTSSIPRPSQSAETDASTDTEADSSDIYDIEAFLEDLP